MVDEFTVIDNLKIISNERIAIFGRTGSGKTFFAKNYLLPHYTKYVFYDIKRENTDVQHDTIITTPKELKNNIEKYNHILYQPKSVTDKDFNDVCETIFNAKDNTLYMDEAALVSSPTKILYYHKVLATQGRSYEVGIINVSQRPRDLNNTLISEAEHLFVFSLSLETDILKLRQQLGNAADEIYWLKEYHFLYYNVKINKSYILSPIKAINEENLKEKKIPPLRIYRPTLEEYIMSTTR